MDKKVLFEEVMDRTGWDNYKKKLCITNELTKIWLVENGQNKSYLRKWTEDGQRLKFSRSGSGKLQFARKVDLELEVCQKREFGRLKCARSGSGKLKFARRVGLGAWGLPREDQGVWGLPEEWNMLLWLVQWFTLPHILFPWKVYYSRSSQRYICWDLRHWYTLKLEI